MDSVVTFLVTSNPEAALRFYRDTLGWTFLRDDGFALVFDMKGVMLRIGQMKDFAPGENTVLGWETRDIAAAVDALVAQGVHFAIYPSMGQDARGICTFPNGDKVAWFKDPDGNVLSLSQHATT